MRLAALRGSFAARASSNAYTPLLAARAGRRALLGATVLSGAAFMASDRLIAAAAGVSQAQQVGLAA